MHALNKMSALLMAILQPSCCHPALLQGLVRGHVTLVKCLVAKRPPRPLTRIGLYRSYYLGIKETAEKEADCVVDFRSDTVTKPMPEMRQAMFEAEVGDDVMEEDPTINKLQERVAKMFGKEAALLVPSGTMGNLICVMCHCQGRAEEVILGDESHIILYEQGSIATVGGVHTRQVRNLPDGRLDLKEVESKIRKKDDHHPTTRVICIENTHNNKGGRVVPLSFMKEVRELADKHKLKVHLDGARVMNAARALNVDPKEIGQLVDSISMCLSKGLAAPVGSLVVGSQDFITRARRIRKGLGGGMRQAGVLAACGLVALDKSIPRLHEDHENAYKLASGLKEMGSSIFTADPSITDSNMVRIHVKEGLNLMGIVKSLMAFHEGEKDTIGCKVHIKIFPVGPAVLRAVTHYHISSDDIDKSLQKFKFVSDMIESGKLDVNSFN
ncbi:putative low-specificity L-threonine aldolase 2 [Holothuria leucospilota]|uniref:Low-specificity L-threonine aldolase 2 n=1 Tax=Holothuria leucospilota TaxID=206669 RepID=A0A9Q1C3L1_HOLLE|nr:putative low-specificity L-threonine aldolase 2 [Holothuria leucospilota]